jgi:hypothetical protein
MHPTICDFVSQNFYDKKLKTDDAIKTAKLKDVPAHKVISWYDFSGEEWVDGYSFYNPREVEAIKDMILFYPEIYGIDQILQAGKSVLVITFYSAQLKKLEVELGYMREEYKNMKIMTVDGAQGSEADLVLPSCLLIRVFISPDIIAILFLLNACNAKCMQHFGSIAAFHVISEMHFIYVISGKTSHVILRNAHFLTTNGFSPRSFFLACEVIKI